MLTSCLTAVKKHDKRYCETVFERSGKTYFVFLKIQVKFLINLKLEILMRPVCILMIFLLFSLLYLIIKLKINLLILLKEPVREKALLTMHVMTEMQVLLRINLKMYHAWSCQNVCEADLFVRQHLYSIWHQLV